jgi:hypothetical protein
MRKVKTFHRRKGTGLGLRPAGKRKEVFAKICGGIDYVAFHSDSSVAEIASDLQAIRGHVELRLVEILATAVTGEPRKRQREKV